MVSFEKVENKGSNFAHFTELTSPQETRRNTLLHTSIHLYLA